MLKKHASFVLITLFSTALTLPLFATEPPKLKLTKQTETSLALTWTAVPGISDYEISYGTDRQASKQRSSKISQTTYTLSSLEPGILYYVKIRSFSEKNNEPWSAILKCTTQVPQLKTLKARHVQDTSITLTWSPYQEKINYIEYAVTYGLKKSTFPDPTQLKKTELSVPNLKPDTTYYAKIRARNPLAEGPWSTILEFATLPYSPGGVPTGLEVEGKLPSRAVLTWNKVTGAEGYELAYSTDQDLQTKEIVQAKENKRTVDLKPSTIYYFKVRSLHKKRPSYWSNATGLLTHPAKPEKLKITGQTVDQVMISWKAASTPDMPQVYKLEWKAKTIGGSVYNTYTAYTNFTFNELKQGKSYSVKIQTLNEQNSSNWCSPLTIKTLPKYKAVIQTGRITATSAYLRWPSYPNTRIYELSYGTDVEAQNKSELQTTSTSLTLQDLLPGITYYIKVRAVLNDQTYGSWSPIASFDTHSLPDSVSHPTVISTSPTSIELVWEEPENVSEYELMLLTKLNSVEGKISRFRKVPARLSGLLPNTEYRIKVRACNQGGKSAWSDVRTFVTNLKQSPSGLKISDVLTKGAIARWQDSAGTTKTSYEIRFSPKGEEWSTLTNILSPSSDLSNLYSYTTYYVQVRAKNRNGFSPWSSSVSFQTLIAPPEEHPAELEATKVKDISAELDWERMRGIKGYHLRIGMNMDASDRKINVKNNTSYTLKNLMPDRAYYIKIRSFNSSGDGPWSEPLLIKTLPSPPIVSPLDVAILEVTSNSIGLLWKTFGKAINYEVSIGTNPQANNLGDPTEVNYPPYTFSALKANTSYYVKVRNMNRGGGGPWSKVLKATTEEEE
jgi:fibronectin type III domain protein